MVKLVCPRCKKVHEVPAEGNCPHCNLQLSNLYNFQNSEDYLLKEAARIRDERIEIGLKGLVGGLEYVVINTEPDRQRAAVEELMQYTGFEFVGTHQDSELRSCVLRTEGSADLIVTSRRGMANPFASINKHPKTKHLVNTRIETYVFKTKDLEKYVEIQKSRGIKFLTKDIIHTNSYSFIQTPPSKFTGNSIGLVQWRGSPRNYITHETDVIDWVLEKPENDYTKNIKELDHVASRVKAENRDAAIIEFMDLTNYNFDFAVYIDTLNSITNVSRLKGETFAMVFTSGILPFISEEYSGPTERFIKNYGGRTHHMAFKTENIEDTVASIRRDGMRFLVDLVGTPEEGIKQTFTQPSENTLLVNEYIKRYKGFKGFFTKSNVTELTRATGKQ